MSRMIELSDFEIEALVATYPPELSFFGGTYKEAIYNLVCRIDSYKDGDVVHYVDNDLKDSHFLYKIKPNKFILNIGLGVAY